MSFYITTGHFYRALYTPLSQNIQVQITGSNTSSFLGKQEIVADVGENSMARGTRGMYGLAQAKLFCDRI